MEDPRPKCELTDGNVFAIIGAVCQALKRAGKKEKAQEFQARALTAGSYEAVLILVHDYVETE